MTLAELLAALPVQGIDDLAFPRRLLGAFRRKSITFCNGTTDETTVVHWFQSRSFTIDLRLPDGPATPVALRQGWVGDTLWNGSEMSWDIRHSYQPRNQWPEPARLSFIGNSVIEFAPSGAYVEDWRQQSTRGTLLGLRLVSLLDRDGRELPMDGGLIVAGEHAAYAQSRLPSAAEDIESYEVSVATEGKVIHSTQPARLGEALVTGEFELRDGAVLLTGPHGRLQFALDLYLPDFAFDWRTEATPDALEWLEREQDHLARHAAVVR